MEELRPDVLGSVDPINQDVEVDDMVVAPTETLESERSSDPDYERDEVLASAGTGFDPVDPAEGRL